MIRPATPSDVPVIRAMIGELAAHERAPEEARATEAQLREALFCDRPAVHGLIAEECGEPVGFAVWFLNFSTWTGTHGVYLEDLYVRPSARGAGHATALLAELAGICVRRGYRRLEWTALDWNELATGFFGSLGAEAMDEWTARRLSGAPLRALAEKADTPPTRGSTNGTASVSN